tara:strand:- start:324 stop:545 length:222 start_codon:yes stop_codon:yes gene_type:complete
MDDIEYAFSQIVFFLNALKDSNTDHLSKSDMEDLSEAIRLVNQAWGLCGGEWSQHPSRKWVRVNGGKVTVGNR